FTERGSRSRRDLADQRPQSLREWQPLPSRYVLPKWYQCYLIIFGAFLSRRRDEQSAVVLDCVTARAPGKAPTVHQQSHVIALSEVGEAVPQCRVAVVLKGHRRFGPDDQRRKGRL